MDTTDKKILEILQLKLPLTLRPYHAIGVKLGLSEEEVLSRIKRLKREGIIRHIGFLFNYRELGYTSTLVAMKVPWERVDEVAKLINSYPEVTHNYARDGEFNLWFVLVAENREKIQDILKEIRLKTKLNKILDLPVEKCFKLRVRIDPDMGVKDASHKTG